MTLENSNKGIPKIIWQTYKTDYKDLPEKAKNCSDTWKNLNPDYQYMYMNDEEVFNFTEEVYGKKMLNLMKSFKVPVMISDLWRVLVIYHFGGIYSDIDTRLTEPLDDWLDRDKKFITAIENGLHYTQWSFMAEPKSPIVKSILDTIIERCGKIDYNMPDFVHYHTANDAFTEGIRRYLDLPRLSHDCEDIKTKNNCFHGLLQKEALSYTENKNIVEKGFFCFSGKEWDTFRGGKIVHEFGSYYWKNDGDYQSWILNPIAEKSRNVL